MELEGRLNSTISLPEVLQFLGMNHMSGILSVSSAGYCASLEMREGRLVGSSNLNRQRRTGQMLVNRGLVDRTVIDEALAYQHDINPGVPIGRILVDRDLVDPEQLKQALRLQLEEELWDIFSLKEGSFKFDPAADLEPSPDHEPLIDLEVEPLILEATRKQDEWERISKTVSDPGAVPCAVPLNLPADREMVHLSRSEWKVLSLVNGRSTVGAIAAGSGIGRFETCRIINSLVASGIVSLGAPLTVEAESEPVAPLESKSADDGDDEPEQVVSSSQEEAEIQMKFASPVSFLVAAGNDILSQLMAIPDFPVNHEDERLAERYWHKTLTGFARADLVTVEGNLLDAAGFEQYLQAGGAEGAFKPILQETIEALTAYLRTLYQLATVRLGRKKARSLFRNALDDYHRRSIIGHSEPILFNDFSARVLD